MPGEKVLNQYLLNGGMFSVPSLKSPLLCSAFQKLSNLWMYSFVFCFKPDLVSLEDR